MEETNVLHFIDGRRNVLSRNLRTSVNGPLLSHLDNNKLRGRETSLSLYLNYRLRPNINTKKSVKRIRETQTTKVNVLSFLERTNLVFYTPFPDYITDVISSSR